MQNHITALLRNCCDMKSDILSIYDVISILEVITLWNNL